MTGHLPASKIQPSLLSLLTRSPRSAFELARDAALPLTDLALASASPPAAAEQAAHSRIASLRAELLAADACALALRALSKILTDFTAQPAPSHNDSDPLPLPISSETARKAASLIIRISEPHPEAAGATGQFGPPNRPVRVNTSPPSTTTSSSTIKEAAPPRDTTKIKRPQSPARRLQPLQVFEARSDSPSRRSKPLPSPAALTAGAGAAVPTPEFCAAQPP